MTTESQKVPSPWEILAPHENPRPLAAPPEAPARPTAPAAAPGLPRALAVQAALEAAGDGSLSAPDTRPFGDDPAAGNDSWAGGSDNHTRVYADDDRAFRAPPATCLSADGDPFGGHNETLVYGGADPWAGDTLRFGTGTLVDDVEN